MKEIYGKWDVPEETEIAFTQIKSGQWDLKRFEAWKAQVQLEEYRFATEDESM